MYPTQNVLAVVDFNMCFTFVVAGWEGAAHDSRILSDALRRTELQFPLPENNKYYLVDAGYAHMRGFMAPYKGKHVRYHLQEFRRARSSSSRRPQGKKEKFNFLHSSCRNIVERTFGVWKARWSILRDFNINYTFDTQIDVVLATMGLHNYLRKKNVLDVAFQTAEDESYQPRDDDDEDDETRNRYVEPDSPEQNNQYWMAVRDMIANEIA